MGFPPRCPDPTSKVRRRREQTTHRKSLVFVFIRIHLLSTSFTFPSHPTSYIPVPHTTQHNISTLRPSQPPPPNFSRSHTPHNTMISRSTLYSFDFIFSFESACLSCGLVQRWPASRFSCSLIVLSHLLRTSYLVHQSNPIRFFLVVRSDPSLLLVRGLMASVRYTALR